MIETNKVYCMDAFELLKQLPDNSVDLVLTDPPYGISFMNNKWDYNIPHINIWRECLRVLKPAGYLLSFCGTKTFHRMICSIEDAGFEIRDNIMWIYGTGFPKSMDINKQVNKIKLNSDWIGYGTALKPAFEPITISRKPLSEKNVALNVLKWGTGGINIDSCRIGLVGGGDNCNNRDENGNCLGHNNGGKSTENPTKHKKLDLNNNTPKGRFPANIILDEDSGKLLDLQSGLVGGNSGGKYNNKSLFFNSNERPQGYDDVGGASRFFYCAKANPIEKKNNNHPTVKPIKLIEYLINLFSRENQLVLDIFCGSGTTAVACKKLNRNFICCDNNADYVAIANKRLAQQSVTDFTSATPTLAEPKEFNMGLKVPTSSPPKLSPTEITSPNSNIKLNRGICS